MKVYEDSRGWQYAVRPGLNPDIYKGFYRKSGKAGWHAVRVLKWHDTPESAEEELAAYAAKHHMHEVRKEVRA